jgi:hypothetical protein
VPRMFLRSIASQGDSMKVNVVVSPEEYADLCKTIAENKDRWDDVHVPGAEKGAGRFINIRRCQLVPPFQIEVELEIRERGEVLTSPQSKESISRSDIDKLWDVLGIFPRVEGSRSVFTDEELREILLGISENAESAHRLLDRIPLNNKAVDDIVAAKAKLHEVGAWCTQFQLKYGIRTEQRAKAQK